MRFRSAGAPGRFPGGGPVRGESAANKVFYTRGRRIVKNAFD